MEAWIQVLRVMEAWIQVLRVLEAWIQVLRDIAGLDPGPEVRSGSR